MTYNVLGGTLNLAQSISRQAMWCRVSRVPLVYKLCLLVFKCLHGFAPRYILAELCVLVADVMRRRDLRSATRGLLNFPQHDKLWPTSIFVRRP